MRSCWLRNRLLRKTRYNQIVFDCGKGDGTPYSLFCYFYGMNNENQDPNQINIELGEEVADGVYSNLAIITHSNAEFVVDFVRMMPGIPKARVKSRIILTPHHAKRLLAALADNVAKFEQVHGEIDINDRPGIPMNFGGPTAQA
jgi:hypothetical protein